MFTEAMFASTSRKLGHLVHHYGGTAVGSFIEPDESPLKGSVTRAMFVDATHDNDPGHIQVGNPLSVCLSVCLSVSVSLCVWLFIYRFVCLFAFLFDCYTTILPVVTKCLGCSAQHCSSCRSRVCCWQLPWLWWTSAPHGELTLVCLVSCVSPW